jgi:hypothetical protein
MLETYSQAFLTSPIVHNKKYSNTTTPKQHHTARQTAASKQARALTSPTCSDGGLCSFPPSFLFFFFLKRKEEKVGNDKMTKSIGNCHIIVKTCCETQTTIAVTGATQKETKTI